MDFCICLESSNGFDNFCRQLVLLPWCRAPPSVSSARYNRVTSLHIFVYIVGIKAVFLPRFIYLFIFTIVLNRSVSGLD